MDPTENPAPSNEDTPEDPQGTPEDAGQEDWKGRYDNLQPAYTQATQRLSEYESWANALDSDPDVQTDTLKNLAAQIGTEKALEVLGYTDGDNEDPDPYTEQQTRIEALEAQLADQQATASESQQLASMEQYVDEFFSDKKLDKDEQDWVISRAVTLPDVQGAPDLEGALKGLEAMFTAKQKSWLKSKRSAVAAPQGTSGTQAVDLTDPEARKAHMAAIAAAQADD